MRAGVKNLGLFFAREREVKKGLKGSAVGSLKGLTGFNKKREKEVFFPSLSLKNI